MGEGEEVWVNKVGLVTFTMKNHVYSDHIALQLKFKTTQIQLCCKYILQNVTPMQLHFINTMI
jgi:hypothetical protein